jgi:hypothetical protein
VLYIDLSAPIEDSARAIVARPRGTTAFKA